MEVPHRPAIGAVVVLVEPVQSRFLLSCGNSASLIFNASLRISTEK